MGEKIDETVEYPRSPRMGAKIFASLNVTILQEGGRAVAWCVRSIAHDVTGRKRAEEALKESEEKFTQTVRKRAGVGGKCTGLVYVRGRSCRGSYLLGSLTLWH